MKLVVVAKTHDVLQQAFLVNLVAAVRDLYAAPVRLSGHQTIAFKQVADQGFGHRGFFGVDAQQLGRGLVPSAFHIEPVQAQTIELVHRLGVKLLGHQQLDARTCLHHAPRPDGGADVGAQTIAHLIDGFKTGVVEAVEVELEGLALHNVGALCGNREVHQCHLRLALGVEPGDFKRRPQISPKKHRTTGHTDLVALGLARYREQQAGIVLVHIAAGFAQLRLFGGIVVHISPVCGGTPGGPLRMRLYRRRSLRCQTRASLRVCRLCA